MLLDNMQTGPGLVMLHFNTFLGKAVFVQTVTPVEPLLQCVIHRFYSSAWIIHPLAKMILEGEASQVKGNASLLPVFSQLTDSFKILIPKDFPRYSNME